jgi:aromatic ring hydroxylase
MVRWKSRNVFIPRDRVFAGRMAIRMEAALLFAVYHPRPGLLLALSEILMDISAIAAEYGGMERSLHIRHKSRA